MGLNQPTVIQDLYGKVYTYIVYGAFGKPRKTFGEEGCVAIYVPVLFAVRDLKFISSERKVSEQEEKTGIDRNRFVIKQTVKYQLELENEMLQPKDDLIYIHTLEPFDADRANSKEVLDRQKIFIQTNEGRTNDKGELDFEGEYESVTIEEIETRNDANSFSICFWKNPLPILEKYTSIGISSYSFAFQRIYAKNSTLEDFDLNLTTNVNNLSVIQMSPISITKDRVEYYTQQLDSANSIQISGFEEFFKNEGADLKTYLSKNSPLNEAGLINPLYTRLINILVLQYGFNTKFSNYQRSDQTGKLTKTPKTTSNSTGSDNLGAIAVAGINENDNIGEINNLIFLLPFEYAGITSTTVYKRFLALIKGLSEYIQSDYASAQGMSPQVKAEQIITLELVTVINNEIKIDSDTTIKVRFKSEFLDIDTNGKINGLKERLKNVSKTPTITLDQIYQWRKMDNPIVEEDIQTIGNTNVKNRPLNFFIPFSDSTKIKEIYKVPTETDVIKKGDIVKGAGYETDYKTSEPYTLRDLQDVWGLPHNASKVNFTDSQFQTASGIPEKNPELGVVTLSPDSNYFKDFQANFYTDGDPTKELNANKIASFLHSNRYNGVPNGFAIAGSENDTSQVTFASEEEERQETVLVQQFTTGSFDDPTYYFSVYKDDPRLQGNNNNNGIIRLFKTAEKKDWTDYKRGILKYKVSRVKGTYNLVALQDTTFQYIPLNQNLRSTSDITKTLNAVNNGSRVTINFDFSNQTDTIKEIDFVGVVGLRDFQIEIKGSNGTTEIVKSSELITPPSAYDETISEFKISLQ